MVVGLVAELAEHPGAEDGPQSWQGTDHYGVRVLLKPASLANRAIWATMVAITATLAETEGLMVAEITAGAASWSERQDRLDLYRPLVDVPGPPTPAQAGSDLGLRHRSVRLKSGAVPSTSIASPLARSEKATRAAG